MESGPVRVKLYPMLAIVADRAHFGGAIRAWHMARDLDTAGSGTVTIRELRAHIAGQGVTDRTTRNWLHDALSFGMFVKWQERPDVVNLVGADHLAAMLGISRMDARPITMPASKLLSRGWRAAVWSSFIRANHQGAEISQDVLSGLTTVPPRTQRRWNREGHVKRKRNMAIFPIPGDHLAGVRDFGRVTSFATTDRTSGASQIAAHIPSTNRSTDRSIELAPRGRTRKHNRFLSWETARSSLILERAQSPQPTNPARLFFTTITRLKRALAARKKRQDAPRLGFVKRRGVTRFAGVWDAVPC